MFGRTARSCAGVMPPGSVVVVSAMCSCCVGSFCEAEKSAHSSELGCGLWNHATMPASAAAAASAELSLLPPPSSRPRRSTSEVQRRLAATPVVVRRFGSTQGARRPLANLPSPPPCRCGSPRACSRRRSERHVRRTVAADNQLDIALQVALSVQHRRPPSRERTFSPRAHDPHSPYTTKIHEYCELFMIIRSLSIQSHDKLGTPVFKLMIIFVCCIQTQLIIFMPHAASASSGAPNSAIWYALVCTTRSRGRELGLDSPIGRKLWT